VIKIFSKIIKYLIVVFVVLLVLTIAGIGLRLRHIPQLRAWHTFIPNEMSAAEIDNATWEQYIERENAVFAEVLREVVLDRPKSEQDFLNRFYKGSKVFPPSFDVDWNRSFLFVPENPVGAVVLLHGLTDSPYSLRHIGKLYYAKNFSVVGIRLPDHGTVPAALKKSHWTKWTAAARLAVRKAQTLKPEDKPLHIAGFSQGGALAIKYALEALENPNLAMPDKLVLISPMAGITRLSRLIEIKAVLARIPGFQKALWISIIPEFNPFKYNSFPVNGVRQARLLISEMRRRIVRLHNSSKMENFPSTIAFQSIVDYTVSTPALINNFFNYLPNNASELVLFDVNRDTVFMPLVRPIFLNMMSKLIPDLPQRYRITIVGNAGQGDSEAVERTIAPGALEYSVRRLGINYPPHVFSLSHISLPFPCYDALYGSAPDPETKNEFGINLGLVAGSHGERGVLEINTNMFFRISSNPLFPYIAMRINEIIDGIDEPPQTIDMPHLPARARITQRRHDAIMTIKVVEYSDVLDGLF